MSLLVDTSVWSLAFRRDAPPELAQVKELKRALESGDAVFVTGLMLQELLQGFNKPNAYDQIIEYFKSIPLLVPARDDYISAAGLCNTCRKAGIQIGTIDALIVQLCIHHDLEILTTDNDFTHISKISRLSIWSQA